MDIITLVNILILLAIIILLILAIEKNELLHSAILLGATSALLSIVFFVAAAPIAAVFELVDFELHAGADGLGGHVVVFADAEIEERAVGEVVDGLALGPLDLLEFVDGGAFAVVGAADTVGEHRLEVGVGDGLWFLVHCPWFFVLGPLFWVPGRAG